MNDLLSTLFDMVLLLACSAFFSGSETALMSLGAAQKARMANGTGVERVIHQLLSRPQRLLAVILVGNMFVNVLLTAQCAALLSALCAGTEDMPGLFDLAVVPVLSLFGVGTGPDSLDGIASAFSAVMNIAIVTPLLMIFGELTPKTVAYANGPQCARISALPLKYLGRLLTPVVWCLERICGFLQRLLRVRDCEGLGLLSKTDIAAALAAGERAGSTTGTERALLGRIMRIDRMLARDAMLPVSRGRCVTDCMTLRAAYEAAASIDAKYVPVLGAETGEVRGAICFADYPRLARSEQASRPLSYFLGAQGGGRPGLPVHPVIHVAPDTPAGDIVELMRVQQKRMAVVDGPDGGPALGTLTMSQFADVLTGRGGAA